MRVGATIFNQNYGDWDRYEAGERGESVPARPPRRDREIFTEEIEIARRADELGFDSVWTIEHHFTPYTMVTNPLQYLTYVAGITERAAPDNFSDPELARCWYSPDNFQRRERAEQHARLRPLADGDEGPEAADAVRDALVEALLFGSRDELVAALDESLLGTRPRPGGRLLALAAEPVVATGS